MTDLTYFCLKAPPFIHTFFNFNISKSLIELGAKIGNVLKLPINEERLQKLTDSYIVSNHKIKLAIGKLLPVSSKDGLLKTFKSFNN
mgnify:CR=1 FL=1